MRSAKLSSTSFGGAGHRGAKVEAGQPVRRRDVRWGWTRSGHLGRECAEWMFFGCDRDGAAVEVARERLKEFAGRFEIRRGNFADLGGMLEPGSYDGMLLDLGVSSAQLDTAERGFSFQQDGPLDMRMDTRQSLTAAELVNGLGADELAKIFWELGEEQQSRRFARAIERDRQQRKFTTTGQLAGLIERLAPRHGKRTHPATKVFQALRLKVNDEIGSLQRGLEAAVKILKPGGRLVVITFHGLEDRVVKAFARERSRDYEFDGPVDVPELRRPRKPELKWVERKAVKPDEAEVAQNPRSRSAQMRVMEKI